VAKWEYKIVKRGDENIEGALNKLGQQGWRAIHVNSKPPIPGHVLTPFHAIMEREIPDSTANPLDDAIARVQLGTKARAQHTDAPPAVELTEEQRIGISACETGM